MFVLDLKVTMLRIIFISCIYTLDRSQNYQPDFFAPNF